MILPTPQHDADPEAAEATTRPDEAGTSTTAQVGRKRQPSNRRMAGNQLPMGHGDRGSAEVEAQKRRLGAYAAILKEAMRTTKLDETTLVRKSLLPEHVVRDALAGTAAAPGYGHYTLAEPLGPDPEAVAHPVAAAGAPASDSGAASFSSLPERSLPAPALPEAATQGPEFRPDRPGAEPIVTRRPDGRVEFVFTEPVVVAAPAADAILALLRWRAD